MVRLYEVLDEVGGLCSYPSARLAGIHLSVNVCVCVVFVCE